MFEDILADDLVEFKISECSIDNLFNHFIYNIIKFLKERVVNLYVVRLHGKLKKIKHPL